MREQKLTDEQILGVCRELLYRQGSQTSMRELQLALRQRFAAVGKTTRLLSLWQSLLRAQPTEAAPTPTEYEVLRRRAAEAERIARAALDDAEAAVARALRSEERERTHQDYWALQIDELRQKLQQYQAATHRTAELERRNLDLHREVLALRNRIAQLESPPPVLRAG